MQHYNSHLIVIMILICTLISVEADIPTLQADSYCISTVHYSNIQVCITGAIDTAVQTFVKDIFEQYLCTVTACPSLWFAGILPVLLQYDVAAQTHLQLSILPLQNNARCRCTCFNTSLIKHLKQFLHPFLPGHSSMTGRVSEIKVCGELQRAGM